MTLPIGTDVVAFGLESESGHHLNEKLATIVGFEKAKKRYKLEFFGDDIRGIKLLRRDNLMLESEYNRFHEDDGE